MAIVRVVFLVFVTLLAGFWSYHAVDNARASYDREPLNEVTAGQENMTRKAAVSELLHQSDLFQAWGLLVLGGIVALIVTNKSHHSPGYEWSYILLGPSSVLVLMSLFSSWVVRKRFAYMVVKNNYQPLGTLSPLIDNQIWLFLVGLAVLFIFAAWFLVLIVAKKVKPCD